MFRQKMDGDIPSEMEVKGIFAGDISTNKYSFPYCELKIIPRSLQDYENTLKTNLEETRREKTRIVLFSSSYNRRTPNRLQLRKKSV